MIEIKSKMARKKPVYPADYFNSDEEDYYVDESPEKLKFDMRKNFTEQQNAAKIKLIKPLGSQAGLNGSDFDISLDNNSQQWFNQINQYWRQCKFDNYYL